MTQSIEDAMEQIEINVDVFKDVDELMKARENVVEDPNARSSWDASVVFSFQTALQERDEYKQEVENMKSDMQTLLNMFEAQVNATYTLCDRIYGHPKGPNASKKERKQLKEKAPDLRQARQLLEKSVDKLLQ